jgi:hypothetical protein
LRARTHFFLPLAPEQYGVNACIQSMLYAMKQNNSLFHVLNEKTPVGASIISIKSVKHPIQICRS